MTYIQWGLSGLIFLLACREVLGRRSRSGRLVGVVAVAGLFLWSWPPSTALFAYTLERWYPSTPFPVGDADAIVVLSAGAYPPDASQPGALPGYGTYLRCRHAAWLFRNWKPLPVVVSGGAGSGLSQTTLADVMRQTLIEAGVPDTMIWTEGQSESTYENALFTARLLRSKQIRRVALVTEGYHMPRSVQCFRKQGIDVVPAGCDFRYLQFNGHWGQFFPSANMIGFNEESLHEWVGLCWYRLTGKI
jgi:uncharacterized SAM-binding protein YcdF (DUF218 family)